MQRQKTPFACHVLVCTNDRKGESRSCADGVGMRLKDMLKECVAERGWRGRVRVSHTGCMGLCARGPNVLLHPQGVWFSEVSPEDIPAILDAVSELLPPA